MRWTEHWGSNKGRRCVGRSEGNGDRGKGWGWARGLSKRWEWDRVRGWAGICDKGWNKGRGGDSGQVRGRDWGWSRDLVLGIRWDIGRGRGRFGKWGEGVADGQS